MNATSQQTPSEPVLSLQGFGVAFGEKTVLANIDLTLPDSGATILLGPSGTGKSTLLRTLAGFNDPNPNLRTWGEARYQDNPIVTAAQRPALAAQNARMMMASILANLVHELPERRQLSPMQQRELAISLLETSGLGGLVDRIDEPVIHLELAQQRHLGIVRLITTGTPLLLLDEPTTGISEADADKILEFIASESRKRAVFMAVHNQTHARRLGGQTVLIAGGVVQEAAPTEVFFTSPSTDPGRAFVRTGSCSVPAPDADPATLEDATPPPAATPMVARAYVSGSFGPRGFLWLKNGQLAGTPRPGIVQDLDYDLKALQRAGITHLISLTETPPETAKLADFGMENIWSPFKDMAAPAITQAVGLCKNIQKIITDGGVVAVHCRAGLGRTGTILAAYLIWEGQEALAALETVRQIEPRWVQSEAQAEFLEKFARFLAGRTKTSRPKN
ncbi:ATP-binding cassette domain-containing protein [Marinobacter sp.]|uniref:phosphatase domain-containing putative toxin n=1 Tax=Marinobacter sp. TaxID=50741 RepID=UPI0019B79406|nr:ATP-binding cassette domain-containing protein [Marinobacter sp.]MBD3657554.1 ATP-binding cassette domain-containing protein [Marinobacter sp.]